jgi:hypothetical protein
MSEVKMTATGIEEAIADMLQVKKPEFYRDLGPCDIAELLGVVRQLGEDLWRAEDERKENKFDVLRDTQHVIFRFTPGNADPRESYSNPAWDLFKPLLLPIMDTVTEPYGYKEVEYSKVMLARLRAGSTIDPHVDGRGSNLVSHKIHVPLVTNPDALFYVNGKVRHLEAGRAYEVNNIVRHGADNRGSEDRIHLIFEHYDAAANPKRH